MILTENEYNKVVEILNQLLDIGGADEKHPLANIVNAIGELIYEYENESI